MIKMLKKLTQAFGPSGYEKKVADVIKNALDGHVDDIRTDNLGNVIAVKRGSGKKIMLAAHMDEIGLIVSYIDDKGFLRFGVVGGVNPLISLGQKVQFENGLTGTVWYEESLENMKDAKFEKMYIDIGARSGEEAEERIKVGDLAVFCGDIIEQDGVIISKALDDRVGCAVLIELALSKPETDNEIYYVFTSQEEVGLRGARTAAFGIMPDMALAVDVTKTGDTPGAKNMAVRLGEGPTIKVKDSSVIVHPQIKERLTKAAHKKQIPFQYEVLEAGGTDAGSIHITAGGIPSGGVSIPTRFIHSPAEMVSKKDVKNTVLLLKAFIED